ncbi:general stress protein [Bacillus xiapuensis]|uniref:general stress protein n=1 Tax=Bacillus xiapuensis TaxID=2014075 RepID=UPI000C248F16|nr:general stress protein [Bacillus xiapuensis]
MVTKRTVENALQAKTAIEGLQAEGFSQDQIYILAHDENRMENISDALNTNEVGVSEQGLLDSMGNVFRSRGDELRTKMESLGLTKEEAEMYERELDEGKLVVVGAKS